MKHLPFIPTFIGTGFGSGFAPIAPGTAGALLATALWFGVSALTNATLLQIYTLGAILLFTLLGTWAIKRLQPYWGADPSRVVIDEMVGVWIPLLATPALNIPYTVLSLALFRLFDIWKPLGIKSLDKKEGAFWVMADDILAGIYSLLIILTLRWLI